MKHRIQLADSWTSSKPFMIDWSIGLIGPELRKEFKAFIDKMIEDLNIVTGGSKRINVSDELQKWMLRKKINIVVDDDPGGTLKSQFILEKGEVMTVDDEAWEALSRFEYVGRENAAGQVVDSPGFIIHSTGKKEEVEKDLEIAKTPIEYFPTVVKTPKEESPEEPKEEPKETEEVIEKFACPICGKEFDTKQQLSGHRITCRAK